MNNPTILRIQVDGDRYVSVAFDSTDIHVIKEGYDPVDVMYAVSDDLTIQLVRNPRYVLDEPQKIEEIVNESTHNRCRPKRKRRIVI